MSLAETMDMIDSMGHGQPTGRVLDYVLATDLDSDSAEIADELIEGLLTRQSMAVIYGDSNSGKTFLAIDIGGAVARGGQWMGRNVDGGMVVYLATESPQSVRNRLRAYQRHVGEPVHNFVIVNSPVNLFEAGADTRAVIDLIRAVESEHGAKCELVIGDTLARMSAGANENSGEDMTLVLRNLDRIKDEAQATVLLIHHTGKDAAKGMRGWSGLRAAVDTELEVTADEVTGVRTLEVTKQRDMGGKGDRIGFRLDTVVMGRGKWGAELTSCVVIPSDAPAKAPKSSRLGETQQAIMALLRGADRDLRIKEVIQQLEPQGITAKAIYNAAGRLRDLGLVEFAAGVMHLNRGGN